MFKHNPSSNNVDRERASPATLGATFDGEGGIWFGFLPGTAPGQAYGDRVHSPHRPEQGEPWGIGEGVYRVGGFPWPFRKWNDKARDDLRAFWRRDPGNLERVAQRFLGSPWQFLHSRRPATSSVNFLAAHDGFTQWDCLSQDDKHNEANGEGNADGHDNNLSHNLGAEGPTDDPGIRHGRLRRVKAVLASDLMGQGVPMILAGDELSQSQQGNNNADCQDTVMSWIDWSRADTELMAAVSAMIALRGELSLADRRFAHAGGVGGGLSPEIFWLHPRGAALAEDDRDAAELACFGGSLSRPDPAGRAVMAQLRGRRDLPPARRRPAAKTSLLG